MNDAADGGILEIQGNRPFRRLAAEARYPDAAAPPASRIKFVNPFLALGLPLRA